MVNYRKGLAVEPTGLCSKRVGTVSVSNVVERALLRLNKTI
jgi:hypothetical protein